MMGSEIAANIQAKAYPQIPHAGILNPKTDTIKSPPNAPVAANKEPIQPARKKGLLRPYVSKAGL